MERVFGFFPRLKERIRQNAGTLSGGELLTKGAGIPKDSLESRIIYCSKRDQRYYLMEEIEKMGTVDAKPNNNWKFVPEAWTKPF